MSKSVDVDLRIRAKNMAGKTLAELNEHVEALAKSQKEQSSSADLAARSLRDLNAESKQLAMTQRELARRENAVKAFADQRKEIAATAAKLQELTALHREMQRGSGGTLIGFSDADMKRVGREIVTTQKNLERLVTANGKAGASLRALGVNAEAADNGLGQVSSALRRAEAAYQGSIDTISRYTAAQRDATAATAEAARRAAQVDPVQRRRQAEFGQAAGRAAELRALREDIEARSAAARGAEAQAEAERRLAAEQREAVAAQERSTRAVREAVQAYDAIQARRAQARAAFAGETEATNKAAAAGERRRNLLIASNRAEAESAARKERLAAVLRRLNPELERNAAAARKAGTNLAFFDDVGRKSLGTYQRLRGQVLGLAASYIGIYQAINTAQKAVEATNRRNALMVGLRTINNGDAAAAADDLAYLEKTADRLGLVLDDLAPNFANIAIAAKSLGLNTTQIRDMFTDTATAAAAMNLSVDDTEGVFRAMTQIFSKARVQAEELRGQLGDRLPGAVVMFAKANNIALSDLDDMLKKGEVGIDFLVNGIQGYADQYANEIDNISNRLQAYINRATNAYNDFLRSLLTGANDQRIKDAFDRITTFFRSEEGTKFAEKVAKAFGALVDVFILAADNMDLVVDAVKLFLGLQLLKFLNDVVIGFAGAYKGVTGFAKGVAAARVAVAGAATSTATLTTRTRLLAAAFGPVGIAVMGLTTLVYKYIDSIDKATERTKDYADALYDLTFAKTESEHNDAISNARKEAEQLGKEADKLTQIRDSMRSLNPLTGAKGMYDFVTETGKLTLSLDEVNGEIVKKLERQRTLYESIEHSEGRLGELVKDRIDREAEERRNTLPTTPKPDEEEDKGSGGNALREAEKREAVERALQKKLLDLDQELFDARTEGNARTQADINKNYELAVQKIESETRERLLEIDALAARVRAANNGNIPEGEQKALDLARERVMELQTALNVRAFEKGEVDAINLKEAEINRLIEERNSKIEYYRTLQETGAISSQEAYAATIKAQDDYNARISTLINELLPVLQAIDPDSNLYEKLGIGQMIQGLRQAQAEMRKLTDAQRVGLSVARMFAGGAADSIVKFGQAIVGIEGGFKAAWDAFRNFAADFLQRISAMILEAIIFQAIQNAITGGSGGYMQAIVSAFSNHTGGLAGSGARTHRVHPAVFAGAGYFHEGGLPGLKTNEVATILKKGEEVLTEDDPRHVFNGGMSGGAAPNIEIVNTIDSGAVVSAGIKAGGKQVVNDMTSMVRANRNEFKTALGL